MRQQREEEGGGRGGRAVFSSYLAKVECIGKHKEGGVHTLRSWGAQKKSAKKKQILPGGDYKEIWIIGRRTGGVPVLYKGQEGGRTVSNLWCPVKDPRKGCSGSRRPFDWEERSTPWEKNYTLERVE